MISLNNQQQQTAAALKVQHGFRRSQTLDLNANCFSWGRIFNIYRGQSVISLLSKSGMSVLFPHHPHNKKQQPHYIVCVLIKWPSVSTYLRLQE